MLGKADTRLAQRLRPEGASPPANAGNAPAVGVWARGSIPQLTRALGHCSQSLLSRKVRRANSLGWRRGTHGRSPAACLQWPRHGGHDVDGTVFV